MSDLGSNGTSIWGPLFSLPYVPPYVPCIAWTWAKHSWTFFGWSTEWNLESNRDSLRKALLLSQNPSNVDVQRSTIGRRGLWTPWPNLRRRADLKKIWARNFSLFHLICFFLIRELMKSDPSNLGGQQQRQQQHQETKLNGSEQRLYRQAWSVVYMSGDGANVSWTNKTSILWSNCGHLTGRRLIYNKKGWQSRCG